MPNAITNSRAAAPVVHAQARVASNTQPSRGLEDKLDRALSTYRRSERPAMQRAIGRTGHGWGGGGGGLTTDVVVTAGLIDTSSNCM